MSENSIGVAFLNFTCEESIITSPIAIILILKIMHLHCKTDNLKCLKKLLKKQLLIQRPATPLPPTHHFACAQVHSMHTELHTNSGKDGTQKGKYRRGSMEAECHTFASSLLIRYHRYFTHWWRGGAGSRRVLCGSTSSPSWSEYWLAHAILDRI